MIARIRTVALLLRPPVVVLLGLFAVVGVTQAGGERDLSHVGRALVVVVAFLLFSVVVNDLNDEAIDRVNLAGDKRRPLVTGEATRREFYVIAATAAAVAVAASALISVFALVVVAVGLLLSAAYSTPPIRICDRGALASMLLPLGYVTVPFLVGVATVRASVRAEDIALLAGLYVGFIGRIVLKDFRDLSGDTLFGKRTFVVRHGRALTCAFSAVCWIAGASTLLAVRGVDASMVGAYAVHGAIALALLLALSRSCDVRTDTALIAAIAIVGRALVVSLIAHLSMVDAGWSVTRRSAMLAAVLVIAIGQVRSMVRALRPREGRPHGRNQVADRRSQPGARPFHAVQSREGEGRHRDNAHARRADHHRARGAHHH